MDERAEKNLSLGLSGFRISGVREKQSPCNENSEIAKCEAPFNSDRGHRRWSREERGISQYNE
jgi:hypothetical protein